LSVLLDTHVWVWWLTPDSPLPARERAALDAEAQRRELFLSAISMWEAQMLHSKGRLELPLPFAEWLEQAADERMLTLVPLDIGVIGALDALPQSFHGDPADRLIVASARSRGMPLATHDRAIRRSRVVTLWRAART
jgi:PIN domain nuclease of toxin-antitoxin system